MSEDRLILDASPPPSVAQQRNTDSPKHEYPESFVRAVRETPVPPPELTQINSKGILMMLKPGFHVKVFSAIFCSRFGGPSTCER